MTQTGSSLSGTIELAGASGQPGGLLTGSLLNSSVSGETVHLETQLVSGNEGHASIMLQFNGRVDRTGNAIAGSWNDSAGDSGTVVLTRS